MTEATVPSGLQRFAAKQPREGRTTGSPATLSRESTIVFAPDACDLPAVELCVNFGLLAGREVTAAEIEQLATDLLARVARVSISSERRYEVGMLAAAAVHQLRIQVLCESVGAEQRDLAELRGRLMEISERWLDACLAARTLELNAA